MGDMSTDRALPDEAENSRPRSVSIAKVTPETMRDTVPAELRNIAQWVTWRYETREDREKKIKLPYRWDCKRRAKVNQPSTWGTFEQVLGSYAEQQRDGIGWVITRESRVIVIDIDGCRDPETGELTEFALGVASKLNSYTELSPSGTGIHIFIFGELDAGSTRCRNKRIEIYSSVRYITITGSPLPGTPPNINERSEEINYLYKQEFVEDMGTVSRTPVPDKETVPQSSMPGSQKSLELTDAEVLYAIERAANAAKFSQLWKGEWESYPTRSEADQALCGLIAFYSQDAVQIERLMRLSGLYRHKWDAHASYIATTIKRALSNPAVRYSRSTKKSKEAGEVSWLTQYDFEETFIFDFLKLLDFNNQFAPGKPFRSPLYPSLTSQEPSAVFERDANGLYKYIDNAVHANQMYTTAQLYAAYISGKDITEFSGSNRVSQALWKIRLLVAMSKIQITEIYLPDLPDKAPGAAKEIYEGYRLLLKCRATYSGEVAPAPYTYRFAEAWAPTTSNKAARGVRWLLSNGYLIATAKDEKGLTLYSPREYSQGKQTGILLRSPTNSADGNKDTSLAA